MVKKGCHAEVQACTEVPEAKHERRACTLCLARGHWTLRKSPFDKLGMTSACTFNLTCHG